MKIFKIIIAIVLIVFGTVTIIQMSIEESGSGLYGAFTGYAILMIISILLLYSANKEQDNTRKLSTNEQKQTLQKNINLTFEEQKESLKKLRKSELLTEDEYKTKIEEINENSLNNKVKSSEEYQELLKLKNEGLFNTVQFNEKIEIITSKLKEKYKEEPIVSEEINLNIFLGIWENKSIGIQFGKEFIIVNWYLLNDSIEGTWEHIYENNTHKILMRSSKKNFKFMILEVSELKLTYRHNDKIFRLNKRPDDI